MPFRYNQVANGKINVVRFASNAPLERLTLQGEMAINNAAHNAMLFLFDNSRVKRYVENTASVPNIALTNLTENTFNPKTATNGIAR